MRILIVIPARGGSKGVPGKNLRPLAKIPLISHVIRAAKRVSLDSEINCKIIVSTDDEAIAAVAKQEAAEVPFMRPAALSGDSVSLIPVSIHAMQFFDEQQWRPDIIASLQPAAPLTPVFAIENALRALINNSQMESVVSVAKIHRFHPFRAYGLHHGNLTPLTEYTTEQYLQKQDRPEAYGFTGGFYMRRRHLLEDWQGKGFALGNAIAGEVIPEHRAVDIDSLVDFYFAETILQHLVEFE